MSINFNKFRVFSHCAFKINLHYSFDWLYLKHLIIKYFYRKIYNVGLYLPASPLSETRLVTRF